uniref:RRM domain-containing protein n=1 Tax=Kalanchoe fedtschenkoi TaxID=63787 RepID=A0A7N0V6A3_KALFE
MSSSICNPSDTSLTKVFVGGLAWETPRELLTQHFEKYGEILEGVVISDKLTGRSKGYGFVTFKDAEAARRACEDSAPIINGRRANCNLASLGSRRTNSASISPPPPPTHNAPKTRSTTPAYLHWYYPTPPPAAAATPAVAPEYSTSFHHPPLSASATPFHGYSAPTTYYTNSAYNNNHHHKQLSYNGGCYINGHFYHAAAGGGQHLMPVYPLLPYQSSHFHHHQFQTLGLPAHYFYHLGPINTYPAQLASKPISILHPNNNSGDMHPSATTTQTFM